MIKTFSYLKKKLKATVGFWQSKVWVISGANNTDNQQFSIIHIGSEIQKNYIATLFFDNYTEEFKGKLNLIQIKALIKSPPKNTTYYIAEGLKTELKQLDSSSSFFLPQWIDAELSIPLPAKNRSTKSDRKNIIKNELSWQISSEDTDIDLFYHKMYIPYLKQRYDGQDIPMKYEVFKKAYLQRSVELLFITHQGKRIAGQVIDYSKTKPRLWSLGVLNSDKHYLSMSCIAACYIFSAEHLKNKGFSVMHIGKSRAIINDGALQFKVKWGIHVSGFLDKGFLITAIDEKNENFFQHSPFIFNNKGELTSAVINKNFNSLSEKVQKEIIKRNLTLLPGLSKLCVYSHFNKKKKIAEFTP